MRYLDFTIRGKTIECCQDKIIADNADYSARLHFASGWSVCTDRKLLIIDDDGKLYEVALAANATEAKIPKFTTPGRIIVGVSAKLDGGQISTNAVAITVRASVRTAASDAIAAPESGADDLLTEYRKKYDALLASIKSSDAVRYVAQELSEAEKAQARKNIGAGTGSGDVTATAIETALGYKPVKPDDLPTVPTDTIAANTAARHTHANKAAIDGITGQVTADKVNKPDHTTDLVQYGAFQIAARQIIAQIPTVPEALKNPNALTIKIGSTTVTYDGSEAKTVEIADGTEVSY